MANGSRSPLGAVKVLAILVLVGETLGLLPYTWKRKDSRFYYKSAVLVKALYILWVSGLMIYGGFLIVNCILLAQDDSAPAHVKIKVAYMTTVHVILDVGLVLNLKVFGQHHSLVNELVGFAERVHASFELQIAHRTLKTVLGVTTFVYFFGCTNAIAVFLSPRSHRLLTCLWAEPEKLSLLIKLLLLFVHLLLNAGQFFFVAFNGCVMILYVYLITPVIRRLKWYGMGEGSQPLKRHGDSQSLPQLSPQQIHQLFSTTLVLQAKYSSALGSWGLLIIAWIVIVATLNLFQAAVFHSPRALVVAMCLSILMVRVCKTCGDAHEICVEAKSSWGSIKHPLWFPHFRRAARPARVPIGSFFYFDRGVMPTLMNIVFTSGANLIISYR